VSARPGARDRPALPRAPCALWPPPDSRPSSQRSPVRPPTPHPAPPTPRAGKSAEAGKDLDAAWAVFVGGDVDEGLWTVTMKRAGEYGTKIDCDTRWGPREGCEGGEGRRGPRATCSAFVSAVRRARPGLQP
jgi:hypothetical protein